MTQSKKICKQGHRNVKKSDGDKLMWWALSAPLDQNRVYNSTKYNENIIKILNDQKLNESEKNAKRITLKWLT